MTSKKEHTETFFNIRCDLLVCLFIVIATLAVYLQVANHAFVNYDDPSYVTENYHVKAGLTLEGVAWSVTATRASNWHPLTWLSHMLDMQLYGMNPGNHHLTNVLFHIVNTLLLFFVLKRTTGDLWPSSFVAVLFALHPLHVESVAWVAERKDVLSTFFWMLTMWSYARYVERPRVDKYLLVLVFFILGLMSKPMLVTLPFVLLLLDYWPLGRLRYPSSTSNPSIDQSINPSIPSVFRLFLEKIPLFVLAAASSVVTFHAQQTGEAVCSLDVYPLNVRIANAIVSYVGYIGKMIWPNKLAVLYPHPGMVPVWQAAAACLLLVSISILIIRTGRKRPYFAVGWLWYIGTLVPVIGLIQVGLQAMADRYTYVPLVGLFIIIGWGGAELAEKWRYKKIEFAIIVAILSAFMTITWLQVRYWNNSTTLFEHALDATSNNYVAHNNLGFALAEQGKAAEAIRHYSQALRINRDFEIAHLNLGVTFVTQGKLDEAIDHYYEALRIKPLYADANNNLGATLILKGKIEEAIVFLREALRIKPGYAEAYNNLGAVLIQKGRLDEAIVLFRKALRIKPDYADANNNLNNTLAAQRKGYRNVSMKMRHLHQ